MANLIRMNASVVGVGDRGDVLDIERTDLIQGLVDHGMAEEISESDAEKSGAVVHAESAADRDNARADEAAVVSGRAPAKKAAPKAKP